MRRTWLIALFVIAIQMVSTAELSFAQSPRGAPLMELEGGGTVNIPNHAVVEGSSRVGGIQPDYFVNLEDPAWEEAFKKVDQIAESRQSFWGKINDVLNYMWKDVFTRFDYKDPVYLEIAERYRSKGKPVPLAEYLACHAGVCREHGLVLHLLLKRMGIANKYAYAKIHRASKWDGFDIVEDHAFTIVEHEGQEWVVDAYYWGFNGFLLKDLLSEKGADWLNRAAPFAKLKPGFRRIIEMHEFPRVWLYSNASVCEALF